MTDFFTALLFFLAIGAAISFGMAIGKKRAESIYKEELERERFEHDVALRRLKCRIAVLEKEKKEGGICDG